MVNQKRRSQAKRCEICKTVELLAQIRTGLQKPGRKTIQKVQKSTQQQKISRFHQGTLKTQFDGINPQKQIEQAKGIGYVAHNVGQE